jgi:hypothetical protein
MTKTTRLAHATLLAASAAPALRAQVAALLARVDATDEWALLMANGSTLALVRDAAALAPGGLATHGAALALVATLAAALTGSPARWATLPLPRQVAGLALLGELVRGPAREDRYAVVDGGDVDPWQMAA